MSKIPDNPTITDIPVSKDVLHAAFMVKIFMDGLIPLVIAVAAWSFIYSNEKVNTEAERQAYVIAYNEVGAPWLEMTELNRIAYAKDHDIWPAFDEGDIMFGKLSKPLVLRRDFKHNGGMLVKLKMWFNDRLN